MKKILKIKKILPIFFINRGARCTRLSIKNNFSRESHEFHELRKNQISCNLCNSWLI